MVQKGETILVEKPFSYVLKSTQRTTRCDYCFFQRELKKCSKCQYVYYCSQNCQKLAWYLHKLECDNLRKVFPKTIPDSAHVLIRTILKLKVIKVKGHTHDAEKNRSFQDLMSHCTEIKKDERRMDHFFSLLIILHSFFGEDEVPEKDFIFELFGKMCINSFNICDKYMNSIGTGIYLNASIIDHSCDPNAVISFDGTTIVVRSIQNIPDVRWENIRISYIDVLNVSKNRKAELNSMYYFLCDCNLCKNETNDKLMNSMICPDINCNGYIHIEKSSKEVTCNTCKIMIEKEKIRQYFDIVVISDYHLKNMKNKEMAYINVCEMLLKKQGGLFYELNIYRIRILDLAFEECIKLQRWNDAIKYGIQLLPGYKKYYGFYHPLVGLLNMKLLKLTLLKNDLNEARQYFEEANEIILVTHGKTHSLYRTLHKILYE